MNGQRENSVLISMTENKLSQIKHNFLFICFGREKSLTQWKLESPMSSAVFAVFPVLSAFPFVEGFTMFSFHGGTRPINSVRETKFAVSAAVRMDR